MNITIPVEGSDEALTNATSPAGYTMHINISLYNLIRVRAPPRSFARASPADATRALNAERPSPQVYDEKKPLCDLVTDCLLPKGNMTMTYSTTIPGIALRYAAERPRRPLLP